MADIELVGVSKRFGNVVVIERLSLSVRANEFIVFLGPSGCGKSTLLRMIAGLEAVDEGEIRLDGHRIDNLPPGARGIAMERLMCQARESQHRVQGGFGGNVSLWLRAAY